jgi:hypothetical protein
MAGGATRISPDTSPPLAGSAFFYWQRAVVRDIGAVTGGCNMRWPFLLFSMTHDG